MALDDVRAEICGVWLRVSNAVRAIAIKEENGSKLKEAATLVMEKVFECASEVAEVPDESCMELLSQIEMNLNEVKQ